MDGEEDDGEDAFGSSAEDDADETGKKKKKLPRKRCRPEDNSKMYALTRLPFADEEPPPKRVKIEDEPPEGLSEEGREASLEDRRAHAHHRRPRSVLLAHAGVGPKRVVKGVADVHAIVDGESAGHHETRVRDRV